MRLVISAVNLVEGGTLTVLREAVEAVATHFPEWEVIVAVNRVGLVQVGGVREIAFPAAKTSWLRRVWLEWVGFRRLSREWKADVWLSLHDITPRVEAGRQYVYCHNPSPFCTAPLPLQHLDPSFRLFRRFYGLLYRCFIHRNAAVIVQQQWLRDAFIRRFGVRKVIVAHPTARPARNFVPRPPTLPRRFLYPALPRVFKNFELLGECAALLEARPGWQGEILITIDGSENAYARTMLARYGHLRTLRFIGLQDRSQMERQYAECDALIFPSLLETWGLPLSEAKARGLPVLAADLPYARESVGTYEATRFFDPQNAAALAGLVLGLHVGTASFEPAAAPLPEAPFAQDWKSLLTMILDDGEGGGGHAAI
jgi:glycosyltransferase involved in cell wall biosynthesis